MRDLREADTAALRWTRTRLSQLETLYTLRDGSGSEHVIARLRWGGTPTDLETADGRWLLTHRGWWIQQALIEPESAAHGGTPFAIRRDWRRRWPLARMDGTEVRWRAASPASSNWMCESRAGERFILITVDEASSQQDVDDPLDVRGRVALALSELSQPDTALIVSVGWYLLLVARTLSRVTSAIGLGG
jgi:hypothetical protein